MSLAVVTEGSVARPNGVAPSQRRTNRRVPIALGIVAFAALAFVFIVGNSFRPAGAVLGALGTPATQPSSPGLSPSPSLPGGLAGAPSGSSPVFSLAPVNASPGPSQTVVVPSDGAAATSLATLTPTPQPTSVPTPRPTPRPTRTPSPMPCTLPAPQLVGQHRNRAKDIWIAAGFTGTVTTLPGNGNYVIASQNRTAGHLYSCAASVTVGP